MGVAVPRSRCRLSPRHARDVSERTSYTSNADGIQQVSCWDRTQDRHVRLTRHLRGVWQTAISPDGAWVWWFRDREGDEHARPALPEPVGVERPRPVRRARHLVRDVFLRGRSLQPCRRRTGPADDGAARFPCPSRPRLSPRRTTTFASGGERPRMGRRRPAGAVRGLRPGRPSGVGTGVRCARRTRLAQVLRRPRPLLK